MKKKLDFSTLSDILISENNGYTAYSRGRWTTPDGVKIPGYLYHLKKPLSNNLRSKILSFKNVRISSGYYRYAPEIKIDSVFLADKMLSTYGVKAVTA